MPNLAAGTGASLDNEGTVTFQQVNTNGVTTVFNRPTGTISLTQSFALGPAVTVTNEGAVTTAGAVNLNGSTVTNASGATISIGGNFTIVGSFTNEGHVTVSGLTTVNGQSQLTNACSYQIRRSASATRFSTPTCRDRVSRVRRAVRITSGVRRSREWGQLW
jgi:hypothetical protein